MTMEKIQKRNMDMKVRNDSYYSSQYVFQPYVIFQQYYRIKNQESRAKT
jgi:hypothetical protein